MVINSETFDFQVLSGTVTIVYSIIMHFIAHAHGVVIYSSLENYQVNISTSLYPFGSKLIQ